MLCFRRKKKKEKIGRYILINLKKNEFFFYFLIPQEDLL
jgi:hypothetical protein